MQTLHRFWHASVTLKISSVTPPHHLSTHNGKHVDGYYPTCHPTLHLTPPSSPHPRYQAMVEVGRSRPNICRHRSPKYNSFSPNIISAKEPDRYGDRLVSQGGWEGRGRVVNEGGAFVCIGEGGELRRCFCGEIGRKENDRE